MKTRSMALWVAAAIASGLLGACAPKPDSITPDPIPTFTANPGDCRPPLAEKEPGGALRLGPELLRQLTQTLQSIRDHCKDSLREYGTSNVARVVPAGNRPGITAQGCVQPAPNDKPVDAGGRVSRPLCFVWVPETSARYTPTGDLPEAWPYYVVRFGNGKGGFATQQDRGLLFIWRVTLSSSRQYDFIYDGSRQIVLVRPVPRKIDRTGQAQPRLSDDVLLWRVVSAKPLDKLLSFGTFNRFTKLDRSDATALDKLQESYALTLPEWDDYNLVAKR